MGSRLFLEASQEQAMRRIDLAYLILAALTLPTGVALGIGMGVAHEVRFAQAHLTITLLVWASLTLFGLSHRAYPELAEATFALPQFLAATAGTLMLPIGIALSVAEVTLAVAATGAFVWLASIGMFLITLVELVLGGKREQSFTSVPSFGSSASAAGMTHGMSRWRESL